MRRSDGRLTVREISLAAMLLAVLFVQEQLLAFAINVQFTVLLLVVYATILPAEVYFPLVGGYIFLDNLYTGSLSWLYTPAMALAWFAFAIVARALRKAPLWRKGVFVGAFGFVYGWIFAVPFSLLFGFDRLWPYLVADLPAEVTMAAVGVTTVLFLHDPLVRLLRGLWSGVHET